MNPFYASLSTDKVHFILHIVNSSGYWDQRDIAIPPVPIPNTLPREPLGSVEVTEIGTNFYILHLYAARGTRNKHNMHPICFCFFGKCLMSIRELENLKCRIYVPERMCRLQGANPAVIREMITAVLPQTPVTFF